MRDKARMSLATCFQHCTASLDNILGKKIKRHVDWEERNFEKDMPLYVENSTE